MKLKKWLQVIDCIGLSVVIWTTDQIELNEQEPIYAGSSFNIPWWLVEYKLVKPEDNDEEFPIIYMDSLGEKYNNKPGFVIVVKEG